MTQRVRMLKIERGMPSVDSARRDLITAIANARRDGVAIIKIIHGYGSSGVGGKLRIALRKSLTRRRSEGHVLKSSMESSGVSSARIVNNCYWTIPN